MVSLWVFPNFKLNESALDFREEYLPPPALLPILRLVLLLKLPNVEADFGADFIGDDLYDDFVEKLLAPAVAGIMMAAMDTSIASRVHLFIFTRRVVMVFSFFLLKDKDSG
jgi:hypothetical protein